MKVGLFFVCGRNFIILPQKSVPSLLISFVAEHNDAEILRESNDFFSEIDKIDTKKRENCLEDSKLAK